MWIFLEYTYFFKSWKSKLAKGQTNIKTGNSFRSSHQRCSMQKGVLRNFTKFTRKHLCQSLFFNQVTGLRLWHWCFPVKFVKFLRTPFLQNTSGRLLLFFIKSAFFHEAFAMLLPFNFTRNTNTTHWFIVFTWNFEQISNIDY